MYYLYYYYYYYLYISIYHIEIEEKRHFQLMYYCCIFVEGLIFLCYWCKRADFMPLGARWRVVGAFSEASWCHLQGEALPIAPRVC